MFIVVYNIFFSLCVLLALPFLFIFLPKKEVKMRLGLNGSGDKGYLWFHCASVGEINAVKPLLKEIKGNYPGKKILLTVMTTTGLRNAQSTKEVNEATLLPLDLVPLHHKLIKRYEPEALIIVETELWISLLSACHSAGIPVMVVNGRISDKSYNKYLLLKKLCGILFRYPAFVGTQSAEDKKRYQSLGFPNVHHTHNLKFCTQLPAIDKENVKREWKIDQDSFVITWGSSREGEEELIMSIYRQLQRNITNLVIIIAPRHLKRLPQVKKLLHNRRYSLLSQLPSSQKKADIILVDSMGTLIKAYAISDIAIVGGSFFDYGGHNPLEPLQYETAAIIGCYHSSCRSIVEKLADNEAVIVSNKKKLCKDILRLASDKQLRQKYIYNGKKVIAANRTSIIENLNHLKKCIPAS